MYGFAAALYLNAFSRRRVEPELSRFGYVCIAFAIVSYARVRLLASTSAEEVRLAGNMAAIGRYALGATFVALCGAISRVPSRRTPITIAWAALGVVLVAAGAHGGVSEDGSRYEIHAVGASMFVVGLVLASAALRAAARHRALDPYARRVVAAAAVSLLAAVVDGALSFIGRPTVDVLAHAGIVGVVMVHWTLLDRFGEATERLESRRVAYSASLEDLSSKHEQLLETEQLAAVGELSAVIAHEVRNPLAVIKNATSAIRKGTHGADAQLKLLDILDEETERLHKLTFELGAFAELGRPNISECDLANVIEDCVNRAQAHRESLGGPEVRFETKTEAETLVADRDLLQSALFYLVQNAMDASTPGALVRLETSEATLEGEAAVELRVIDEGEGMDPETLAKAPTPFFTARSRGTGLALAIVHRIAVNHGGRLVLESQKGVGTTARLILPRHRTSVLPSFPGLSATTTETLGGSARA
jgi:signal transduction histidine kinase